MKIFDLRNHIPFFLIIGLFIFSIIISSFLGDLLLYFQEFGGFHFIASIISIILLVYCIKIKNSFGKIIGRAFNYIILGVIFFFGLHTSELIFEDPYHITVVSDYQFYIIEHLIFIFGMICFGYAFYSMLRDIKK